VERETRVELATLILARCLAATGDFEFSLAVLRVASRIPANSRPASELGCGSQSIRPQDLAVAGDDRGPDLTADSKARPHDMADRLAQSLCGPPQQGGRTVTFDDTEKAMTSHSSLARQSFVELRLWCGRCSRISPTTGPPACELYFWRATCVKHG
jgi:hypothetical protein